MIRFSAVLPFLLLAACAYGSGGPPPLPPLAGDMTQPGPAFAEHVLQSYFAATPSGQAPTVCTSLTPRALSASQEKSLIARFARLAPLARCKPSGSGHVDAITGAPAAVIAIYDFACDGPTSCAGWASVPGRPSASYQQRWQDGAWHFAADLRLIAR